jgi:putative FmdB family regulatory protein
MPIYEYLCANCSHEFDIATEKMIPPENPRCPKCGWGNIFRRYSPPLVQFKGNGFYTTDNGNGGNKDEQL